MINTHPGSDSSIATDQASSNHQNPPSPQQEGERVADTGEIVVTGTDSDTDAAALSAREQSVAAKEMVVRSREDTANLRDDVAQSREKTGDLRDDAAQVRETTVDQREVDAASREKRIDEAESMKALLENHLEGLRQANEHLVISSVQAHTMTEAVQKAKDEMGHIAHHDFLTGLPNRLLLAERIVQSLALAKRHDKQLAVLFVDLDRFKVINDSLGHTIGDTLLQAVAQRLQASVRGTDTVSRQGGDEFIILLSEVNDEQTVGGFADKVCKAIGVPFTLGDQVLHIGASVGVSMYPEDGEEPEALIHNADAAMYHAKHSRRGRFAFFKPEMTARAIERQQTEASLYVALDKREFELYYQAQVALETGKIIGSEALIRWRHPARGFLVAGAFVPIAEACGAIIPIGRWVLREACRQTQAWLATGLPRHIVSVNISATEFGSADFLGNVKAVLHDTGLAPEYLELELTETVLMSDVETTMMTLRALKSLGIGIAIDDFGTGYSSLSYLKQFPVTTLKIDQSFVADIGAGADGDILVDTVIQLGRNLKHRVIAEGVETAGQLAFLGQHHCDEGQGYYLSRPLPAEVFGELLKTGVRAQLWER